MAYTPSGTIAFYRVPWKSDYKDVRLFTSKTEESNYFSSPLRVEQNYTYIRDKQAIKVNANKEAMEQYNYIRYMNENFSLKWFYAFITKVEYINQNACYVYFVQDAHMTWWDCYTIKSAYVKREHVSDESDSHNTIVEDFKISNYEQDYIDYSVDYTPKLAGNTVGCAFIVITSNIPLINLQRANATKDYEIRDIKARTSVPILNNIRGIGTYVLLKTVEQYNKFLETANKFGFIDSVSQVIMCDYDIIQTYCTITEVTDSITGTINGGGTIQFWTGDEVAPGTSDVYAPYIITKMSDAYTSNTFTHITVAGYEPKNRKIFHYPCCKWVIDANNGDYVELQPQLSHTAVELIIDEKISLDTKLSVRAIPRHYALTDSFAATAGWDYFNIQNSVGIVASVSAPFVKDNAAVWNALNSNTINAQTSNAKVKIALDAVFGAIDTVASAGAGVLNMAALKPSSVTGLIGAGKQGVSELTDTGRSIARDVMQLRETEANINDKANLPSQLMNMTTDDSWIAQHGFMKFTIRHMCAPLDEIKRYDKYLSKYGYKTNDFKIPAMNNRQNWNYVETSSITIAPVEKNGYAPTDNELTEIENIFNSGVTFWHINDVGNYGDYTNEIVGGTNGK